MSSKPGLGSFRARVFRTGSLRALLRGILLAFFLQAIPPLVLCGATLPITGRYVIAPGSTLQPGGTVDIDPRHPAFTINCRLDTGKTLRGLGLSEGNDLVGASLYTGGIAHGLAIYKRASDGRVWHGRWITSIDSASSVGVMDIDTDPKQPGLAGRHHFSGHRASTGQFEGTVTLSPQSGSDFTLAFTTAGGATLYKGVGLVRGDRLVVAWSFGSSPALAVYEASGQGELNSRRLSLRGRGGLDATDEHFFAAGALVEATGTGLAGRDARPARSGGGPEGLSASEPSAPTVKATSYNDLLSRFGNTGWAERWISCQLTLDEQRLLQQAILRHHAADPAASSLGAQTVSQLIEEQRSLGTN